MDIDQLLRNRFILYYTIREFWKKNSQSSKDHKYSITQLYALLFPSEKTNDGIRSAYDAILRRADYKLDKWLKSLETKSGVSSKVWSGEQKLDTGITDECWNRYIDARENRENNTLEYNTAEVQIRKKLELLFADTTRQSDTVKTLFFFLAHGEKKNDIALGGRLQGIEADMEHITQAELSSVDTERLEAYLNKLIVHTKRVMAIIEIKKWSDVC